MWDVLLKLYRKFWPECAYKLILVTDKLECEKSEYVYTEEFSGDKFDDVVILDGTWYEMITAAIEHADTDYIMMFMDDYLLCDYVRNEDMEYYMNEADRLHAANIRLKTDQSLYKPGDYELDNNYFIFPHGVAYSITTQAGLWNTEVLKSYMKPEWSAWDFEKKGSIEIVDDEHPCLGSKYYMIPYVEGVNRGRWLREGVDLCARNNIHPDYEKRPPMTNFQMAWVYFKGGLVGLNPTLVTKILKIFGK